MKKSFTLIELLVVISIMIIFIGTSLAQYNGYTEQTRLKNEAKKLVDVIELAKKKALSSDLFDKNCSNFTGYKITVSTNYYSLLFGCGLAYTEVQRYNLSTANITITPTTGDLNFPPLMKNLKFNIAPNINSIQLKNSMLNKCVTISISEIGLVELNETLVTCL